MRRSLLRFAPALTLLAGLVLASASSLAQDAGAGLTTAQKLAKLKAAREAARAAGTAKATATATATTAPTATATATTAPTATATATTAPTTTATATSSAAPPGSGSAAPVKSGAPAASGSAPPVPEVLPNDIEALRTTREQRRHAEVERLRQRWGELLADDRAKAELKVHAERVAQLQRVRALAQEAKDAKLLEKVDLLITAEELRDADVMNSLRTGGAK